MLDCCSGSAAGLFQIPVFPIRIQWLAALSFPVKQVTAVAATPGAWQPATPPGNFPFNPALVQPVNSAVYQPPYQSSGWVPVNSPAAPMPFTPAPAPGRTNSQNNM